LTNFKNVKVFFNIRLKILIYFLPGDLHS